MQSDSAGDLQPEVDSEPRLMLWEINNCGVRWIIEYCTGRPAGDMHAGDSIKASAIRARGDERIPCEVAMVLDNDPEHHDLFAEGETHTFAVRGMYRLFAKTGGTRDNWPSFTFEVKP